MGRGNGMVGSEAASTALLAQATELRKSFGRRVVLDRVSFVLRPGEILGLAGANGAGKTTLIKIILGLLRPDAGSVAFRFDAVRRAGGELGYVPEEPVFPPELTPRELLSFFAWQAGMPMEKRRIELALEMTGIAADGNRRIRTFSKGMRRRLGIAQAILTSPKILVLDEPDSGLDPLGRSDLNAILTALKTQETGILLATHDLHIIERLSDRVLLLNEGRIGLRFDEPSAFRGVLEREFMALSGRTPAENLS